MGIYVYVLTYNNGILYAVCSDVESERKCMLSTNCCEIRIFRIYFVASNPFILLRIQCLIGPLRGVTCNWFYWEYSILKKNGQVGQCRMMIDDFVVCGFGALIKINDSFSFPAHANICCKTMKLKCK